MSDQCKVGLLVPAAPGVAALLFLVSRHSYLLYHSLVELFAVLVA